MSSSYTNALAGESSPYLQQHAHNPVNWEPWSEQALSRAEEEGKLLLISIGYAACHWCHVMEKECFEDEEVAEVMNQYFINIKIDREERPDLDQVYMDALQLMTGAGGWPLNIVALPDGRPFWGATFVKKKEWIQVLDQLSRLYEEDPAKVEEYASNLSRGVEEINKVVSSTDELPGKTEIREALYTWAEHFDESMGGNRGAPKFMMPATLELLLHYTTLESDKALNDHLRTTLKAMAYGGIYDHVGGGFSRYAVDTRWHVPHFEKMLYDNAQLVSLYAKAYARDKKPLYAKVVRETLAFVHRELSDGKGAYFSSLDADSPDEKGNMQEGAYYSWKAEELQSLLGADYPLFRDYYNVNAYGRWEEDTYVLIRKESDVTLAAEHKLEIEEFNSRIEASLNKLSKARKLRTPPGLDDKILTGWNAWMLQGLIDAYRYLGDETYLQQAFSSAEYIEGSLFREDGGLYHGNNKKIHGFLEDYAPLALAYFSLYEVTQEERYLYLADSLVQYCLENFADPESGLFFFTDRDTPVVVRRSIETGDNVIPASNAVMAKCMFLLDRHFPHREYGVAVHRMILGIQDNFKKYAHGHAYWMQVLLLMQYPFHELVIIGKDSAVSARKLWKEYLPHSLLAATSTSSDLPLFKDRWVAEKTLIYNCTERSCELPVEESEIVLRELRP